MSERDDHVTAMETGGGGAVINGILMTALVLLGLFLIFGDQIYSGSEMADVNGNLSQIPAKQ